MARRSWRRYCGRRRWGTRSSRARRSAFCSRAASRRSRRTERLQRASDSAWRREPERAVETRERVVRGARATVIVQRRARTCRWSGPVASTEELAIVATLCPVGVGDGRPSASQAECRGFKSLRPLHSPFVESGRNSREFAGIRATGAHRSRAPRVPRSRHGDAGKCSERTLDRASGEHRGSWQGGRRRSAGVRSPARGVPTRAASARVVRRRLRPARRARTDSSPERWCDSD